MTVDYLVESREKVIASAADARFVTCPYLDYRREGDGRSFDVERGYCEAAGRFVQPMRADVCNDRFELAHEADCEIYRDREGLDPAD